MQVTPKAKTEAETIRAQLGGNWRDAEKVQEVRDPSRGDVVAYAPISTTDDCNDALAAAHKAKDAMAAMPGYERAALLRRADRVIE